LEEALDTTRRDRIRPRAQVRMSLSWYTIRSGRPALSAQTEFLNQPPIALQVRSPQVVEEPPTATYHLQQAASTMVVFRVRAKVARELFDSSGKQSDLHRFRPVVVLATPELLYDGLLLFRIHA